MSLFERNQLLLIASLASLSLAAPLRAAAPLSSVAPMAAPSSRNTYLLSMEQAEAKVVESSALLAAAEAEAQAATAQARSARAVQLPRLSFDASARYQSVVPEIQTGPAGALPLGDNESFSYGPTAQWLLFDTGGTYRRWRAAQAVARAKRAEADAVRRSVILDVRMAYLSVQRAVEEQRLLTDAVRLSASQYKDITSRQKAGAGSRLDSLSSHQELLARERQLVGAQVDLAIALRRLFRLTKTGASLNADLPAGEKAAESWPVEWRPPTLIVRLDAIAATRGRLALPAGARFDIANPSIVAITERARAALETARAAAAGHGPAVSVSGRVSRDYPNGPIHETITQKSAGVSASLPLFEFGRVSDDVASQKRLAVAAALRRDERVAAMAEEWLSGWDRLRGLIAQEAILLRAASETGELARITFDSYRSGGIGHVEVENANFRALETQVALAQAQVGIASLQAALGSMAEPDDELAFLVPGISSPRSF